MSVVAAALDPGTTVLADGIINWVNNKGNEVQTTIRTLTLVAATGSIAITAAVTRLALAKCAGVILVAGIVVAAVFKITSVSDKVGEEFDEQSLRPAVVQIVMDQAPARVEQVPPR